MPKAKIALSLLRKKLGFRTMLEVIPTDASLVRGSHGRPTKNPDEGAIFMSDQPGLAPSNSLSPTDVFHIILRHLE